MIGGILGEAITLGFLAAGALGVVFSLGFSLGFIVARTIIFFAAQHRPKPKE